MPGGVKASNWGGSFLVIPEQSKNKAAAWAFVKYMLATKEGQNDIFQAVDYFPAYTPAYEDASIYDATDDYFSGQQTKKLWAELAKELGLSMPTVLTNVNELIAKGLIVENGEYASTGGRKAKSIGINREYCRAMGLVITANHLEMVLVNLGNEIEHLKRVRLKFSPDIDYSVKIAGQVQQFLKECKTEKDILGIGIAIPGIIDQNEKTVLKSHALQVENYSLRFLEQALGIPVYFENDANSAMLAEDTQKYNNAIYLSLNHTLVGAFCIDGKLFRGQNQKA